MKTFLKDFSMSAASAGFIAVLIGFASSIAIVFQAAVASGANAEQIESWVWALGIGMGLCTFGLSLYYKRPLIIVWSTPGAALIAASLSGSDSSLEQATGTFIFVGLLIVIVGVSGLFKKLMSYIPLSIASAMLAGILLQFGIGIFSAMNNMPVLVILMFATYVAMKYYLPRYTILVVLLVGTLYCLQTDALTLSQIDWSFATPQWVTPEFSLASIIGIGIPLFIVTMASQNLPGVAILKSSGYSQQNVSPIITTTGLSTLAFAPFGGFTFNLAAITAAICTSEEAHIDPSRRYIAGVSAGVFNIIAGLFGAAVVSLFAAFPHSMVAALAGLALLSTIANSLKAALQVDSEREAALVTFLLSASSLSFFGIGSAFWGVVVGMLVLRLSKI